MDKKYGTKILVAEFSGHLTYESVEYKKEQLLTEHVIYRKL
jgi:hypothetical protein